MVDSLASSTVLPPPLMGAGGFPGFLGMNGLGGMGGLGAGGLGALGDIGNFFGGWPGATYIPTTPLGALEGLKGDLLVPMVGIGVALFILIIVVLAVKAALTWKLDMLKKISSTDSNQFDLFPGKKLLREIDPQAANQDRVNELAAIVMQALDSERCLDKIICSIGSYGQGSSWSSYFSMIEGLVAEDYRPKLSVMKSCAEGSTKVEDFQCGATPAGTQPKAAAEGQQAAGARPNVLSTLMKNAAARPQQPSATAPAPAENQV